MRAKGIIVHCSDSPQGRGDTASTIHSWHKTRGFDGIGYHYIILEDGTVESGRPEYWTGAHATGYNDYIGICLIGRDSFTEDQLVELDVLVHDIYNRYDSMTSIDIKGHNEVSNKSCPNINIREFVGTLGLQS